MASKIEKTIARQKEKIAEGQYYEAHQHLRVITSRYLASSPPNYSAATNILSSGALLLLQASSPSDQVHGTNGGSAGSGGDLCMYLLDVYNKSETKVDSESKGRLLRLLRAFPKREPTRKRFVSESIAWSAKFGEYPAGDPEIYHVAGQLFAEEGDVYEAERHLIHGTRDSPSVLTMLEFQWYAQDSPDTAPLYLSRAVLPYVLLGNLRAANQCLLLFTSRLPSSLNSEPVTSTDGEKELIIYPALPLLNFLTLLLLAVQRGPATGARNVFAQLKVKYKSYLQDQLEGLWDDSIEQIGEIYFGVKKPRQNNPLLDMMGSMFGGAMGGGGGGSVGARRSGAPPVMGVD